MPAEVRDHLVSNLDLVPTLLDYCGVESEQIFHGRSLLPIISDSRADWRAGLLTQHYGLHEPITQRAWHAGESEWRGETACNDFSVGIELEGCDDDAYDEPQYRSLAALIDALRRRYSTIEADAIAGHSDIAPGRKTDPGPAFDWPKLHQLLG